jgi:lipopolysaccharide heptosyltransferase III
MEPNNRPKLLAIVLMYLGDVAITTPALRALRQAYRDWELHVLVPMEAAPLLQGINWLDRVWAFPRIRGALNLTQSLPIVRDLRRERFAVSIDFIGNDRGALLSRLISATRRIGVASARGFALRSRCYTEQVEPLDGTRHASIRAWAVTEPLQVPFPKDMSLEVASDPRHQSAAAELLGQDRLLCYVTASQKKREWPEERWLELANRLAKSVPMAFTGGASERERQVLSDIARRTQGVAIIHSPTPLELLLAIIARAKLFVTADTGPLHFAAGLHVPTLSLFGPTSAHCWAPLGSIHRSVQGGLCPCSGHIANCVASSPCMAQISVDQVGAEISRMLRDAPAHAAHIDL